MTFIIKANKNEELIEKNKKSIFRSKTNKVFDEDFQRF